jgi:hypothetical protein
MSKHSAESGPIGGEKTPDGLDARIGNFLVKLADKHPELFENQP